MGSKQEAKAKAKELLTSVGISDSISVPTNLSAGGAAAGGHCRALSSGAEFILAE